MLDIIIDHFPANINENLFVANVIELGFSVAEINVVIEDQAFVEFATTILALENFSTEEKKYLISDLIQRSKKTLSDAKNRVRPTKSQMPSIEEQVNEVLIKNKLHKVRFTRQQIHEKLVALGVPASEVEKSLRDNNIYYLLASSIEELSTPGRFWNLPACFQPENDISQTIHQIIIGIETIYAPRQEQKKQAERAILAPPAPAKPIVEEPAICYEPVISLQKKLTELGFSEQDIALLMKYEQQRAALEKMYYGKERFRDDHLKKVAGSLVVYCKNQERTLQRREALDVVKKGGFNENYLRKLIQKHPEYREQVKEILENNDLSEKEKGEKICQITKKRKYDKITKKRLETLAEKDENYKTWNRTRILAELINSEEKLDIVSLSTKSEMAESSVDYQLKNLEKEGLVKRELLKQKGRKAKAVWFITPNKVIDAVCQNSKFCVSSIRKNERTIQTENLGFAQNHLESVKQSKQIHDELKSIGWIRSCIKKFFEQCQGKPQNVLNEIERVKQKPEVKNKAGYLYRILMAPHSQEQQRETVCKHMLTDTTESVQQMLLHVATERSFTVRETIHVAASLRKLNTKFAIQPQHVHEVIGLIDKQKMGIRDERRPSSFFART
jgi:predicted transcriptional regulator